MTVDSRDYLLRAPWYVIERGQLSWDDPAAACPEIQMYDRSDFVKRVVSDPRDSLAFSDGDRWTFLLPVDASARPASGRGRVGGYQRVPLGPRKLYQPSHDRFYAVFAELFADQPGHPRPGAADGVTVGFVVRRQRVIVPEKLSPEDRAEVRRLAGEAARQAQATAGPPLDIPAAAADEVVTAGGVGELGAEYDEVMRRIGAQRVVEAWTVAADQRGRWQPIADADLDRLVAGEQKHTMWRVPPAAAGCTAAQSRSLWFGAVPTSSAETDPSGARKFDEESTYSIRCFARRNPPPERAHCPPCVWLSRPSASYRLAAFFDPLGTRNRRFPVRTPDLRALRAQVLADLTPPPQQDSTTPDARAGFARGAARSPRGGLQLVQPPGSQLSFDPFDGGIPKNGKLVGEKQVSTTYALELVTIVAMFLLQMFLPIVLMLFQLWWMLALRFRWPLQDQKDPLGGLDDKQAFAILQAHFDNNGTIASLEGKQKEAFDRLAGATGAAEQLAANDADSSGIGTDSAAGRALVEAMAPQEEPPVAEPGKPLPTPEDPVCHRE